MENFTSDTQIHERTLRVVLTICLIGISILLPGQSNLSTSSKKAQKLYFKADKEYKNRDFESAIELLHEATLVDNSFYEAYLRKGSLYNALGLEDSVYANFSKYVEYSPNPSASVLERLAHMAFDRGYYLKSKEFLDGFLEKVPEKAEDREIDLLMRSIPFALEQLENPLTIEIEELPEEINRYGLQYLPAMTVDEKTMVYTKRNAFSSDEDIVVSYKNNGLWSPSESISDRINTPLNEGAATISADGRTMIFTACDRRDSYGSCDLYISRKTGESWSRPKNLGKTVNSKYWESQPSLSADGRTLFFASNRPGGYGGRDLWVTIRREKDWSLPKNLGSEVNSFKDETTPFIHFNGQTLYFSSNSYPGLGGFDLFFAKKTDTTWSEINNLGFPINTHRDEVALLISSDGSGGYFAKELQKNREILDSKIVRFSVPENIKPIESYYLSGKVIDKETKEPLKAALQIVDVSTNEKLYENYSDSITGKYYLVLPAGGELAGYVKRKGYLYKDFSFSAEIDEGINVDTLDIELIPIKAGVSLILENIYFETDSYELDERSMSEIASAAELLNENSTIQIEIAGHTDNVGKSQYNQELSEKRSLSVYNALIQRGISKDRMQYKGYGDSKPLKPNSNDINRQSNRRIEFSVLRPKQ